VQRNIVSPALTFCGRGMRIAAILNTTLVLGPDQPDFSTEAINSALIAQRKLRAITQFRFGVTWPGANSKSKIWLSREETLCPGESCLDDNS
jgi:hypothetical protein